MTIHQGSSMEQTISKKVSEVLNRTILIHNEADLTNEGLNSSRTIELIVSLEVEFEIEVNDEDLLIENFSTISKIVSLLTEKYGVSQ